MSNDKIIISPSILSADFTELGRDVRAVEDAGADWIHVDVMDGHFVPNISIGVPVVKSLKKTAKVPLDVHLMIENPEKYIGAFAKAGADIITFHYEAAKDNVDGIIDLIRSFDLKVGISIKPKTNQDVLIPYLNKVNMVLVMTVEPGFGGQEFMGYCAQKIPYIRAKAPESLIVQVDGGINDKTAKICKGLGANSLVAGSYIYGSDDIKSAIESLR
ncbi:ribulose-phosphate 3-epimerase [bacterium]|nr:ribulose-phosphate 3-epimerase [bacterium]